MKKYFFVIHNNSLIHVHTAQNEVIFDKTFPNLHTIYKYIQFEIPSVVASECEVYISTNTELLGKMKNENVYIERKQDGSIKEILPPVMCVYGNRNTEQIVGMSSHYHTGLPDDKTMLEGIIKAHGGVIEDYSLYYVYTNSEAESLMQKEFEIHWADSDPMEIAWIDFTKDEIKDYLQIQVDKSHVDQATTDFILMDIYILTPEKNVNKNFNETIYINVKTPSGVVPIKCAMKKGKLKRKFYPKLTGMYHYPAETGYTNNKRFKVLENIEIYSVYDTSVDSIED